MSRADQFLPKYQFSESHDAQIDAAISATLAAVEQLSESDDALVRTLLALRELPSRLLGALGAPGALREQPRFGMQSFTLLERCDDELVYGLVGRFWRPSFGLAAIADASAFRAFDADGVAKLTMSFAAEPLTRGGVRLVTQTRIYCPDRGSLTMFSLYWPIIRTFSGLIRRRMLAAIRRKAEAAAHA